MLPTIANWILNAAQRLGGLSSSPHLDAELILALVTKKSREKLLTGGGKRLSFWQLLQANYYLHLRRRFTPIAYITHRKKFLGFNFYVNKNVLIPRPETENLVLAGLNYAQEYARKSNPKTSSALRVLDIGCGSGCIGLSFHFTTSDPKSQYFSGEKPHLLLSDISPKALAVAHKNAEKLRSESPDAKKLPRPKFIKSNLLANINITDIDIIFANLPYVDASWDFINADTKHEPNLALFASDNGLALIKKLLRQIASQRQNAAQSKNAHAPQKPLAIFLEADPSQLPVIEKLAKKLFQNHTTSKITTKTDGFTIQIVLN